MKNFLMISPFFVPSREVGAKRTLCFARHLPNLGWKPAVIALPEDVVRDPNLESLMPDLPYFRTYRSGPISWFEDHVLSSLSGSSNYAANVTRHTNTNSDEFRSRNPISKFFREVQDLPFDRYTKYLPSVFLGALSFLKKNSCQAIYATGGPFSSFILATALSKATGLPLVLDLRDPYTIDPIYKKRWTAFGNRIAKAKEAWFFSTAKKVILNTESSMNAYVKAYENLLPPTHFAFIRNHFDPDLYDPLPPAPSKDSQFKIVFFGHLTPIRDSCLFLEAMRKFIDDEELSPEEIRFVTLGERTGADKEKIDTLELDTYIEEKPWVSFTKSRQLLGSCDLLLDLTSEQHHLRISGKFYDYLAAQRPILTISSNPELLSIYKETNVGQIVPNEVPVIYEALSRAYKDRKAGLPFSPNKAAVAAFEAKPASQKLAKILDEVTH